MFIFVMNMTEEKEFESYAGEASLSPIPLSIGSPPIRPEDKNKIRANAVEAMHHYANQEIAMLKKQADLIMQQVRDIEQRLKISAHIYESDMRFVPVINQVYYLYEKDDHYTLSLIGPNEWGAAKQVKKYIATVKLLGDHSWDVLDRATEPSKGV